MKKNKSAFFVAGGTAGHINAAISIGEEFKKHKYSIAYISGQRYLDYQILKDVKDPTYNLNSMALRYNNPIKQLKSLLINTALFFRALTLFIWNRPSLVIGTGGYICGSVILAARVLGIKTAIVEQNAVMGLTNRILKNIVHRVFINFENTKNLTKSESVLVSGNPIRAKIRFEDKNIKESDSLLVFGGSLGARQINEAITLLIEDGRLEGNKLLHQVGRGNVNSRVEMKSLIKYHQVEYISDMQKAYAAADVIICRAGASTISELEVIGKPTIIIPYSRASDNHQYLNAIEYKKKSKAYTKIIDSKLSNNHLSDAILIALNEIRKTSHVAKSCIVLNEECASYKIYKEMKDA